MQHPPGNRSDILMYQAEDGSTRIGVRLESGTVWLAQAVTAELYQTTVANINIHLKNIYEDGELPEESVVKDYLTTATDCFDEQIEIQTAQGI